MECAARVLPSRPEWPPRSYTPDMAPREDTVPNRQLEEQARQEAFNQLSRVHMTALQKSLDELRDRTDLLEARTEALHEKAAENEKQTPGVERLSSLAQGDATYCLPQVQNLVHEAVAKARADWQADIDEKIARSAEGKFELGHTLVKEFGRSIVARHAERLATAELKIKSLGVELCRLQGEDLDVQSALEEKDTTDNSPKKATSRSGSRSQSKERRQSKEKLRTGSRSQSKEPLQSKEKLRGSTSTLPLELSRSTETVVWSPIDEETRKNADDSEVTGSILCLSRDTFPRKVSTGLEANVDALEATVQRVVSKELPDIVSKHKADVDGLQATMQRLVSLDLPNIVSNVKQSQAQSDKLMDMVEESKTSLQDQMQRIVSLCNEKLAELQSMLNRTIDAEVRARQQGLDSCPPASPVDTTPISDTARKVLEKVDDLFISRRSVTSSQDMRSVAGEKSLGDTHNSDLSSISSAGMTTNLSLCSAGRKLEPDDIVQVVRSALLTYFRSEFQDHVTQVLHANTESPAPSVSAPPTKLCWNGGNGSPSPFDFRAACASQNEASLEFGSVASERVNPCHGSVTAPASVRVATLQPSNAQQAVSPARRRSTSIRGRMSPTASPLRVPASPIATGRGSLVHRQISMPSPLLSISARQGQLTPQGTFAAEGTISTHCSSLTKSTLVSPTPPRCTSAERHPSVRSSTPLKPKLVTVATTQYNASDLVGSVQAAPRKVANQQQILSKSYDI